ncbi:MAG: T9SS type A sorting domain-containing protein, partial [Bernardetiaceae bacterium]|nr:T9SS type A sorting domain-containing protein [Bernardetiaceae bacterium]
PQTVTLTGLTADGAGVNVTASFSDDAACTFTQNNLFTSPADCGGGDVWNVDQDIYYTSIQDAVDAAVAGETIKIIALREYIEDVVVDKTLIFTSDATDYTQIEITSIEVNTPGGSLTITGDMSVQQVLNMQAGDVFVNAGVDFALRSTETYSAMVINADPTNTVQGRVIMERYMPSVADLGGYDGVGGYHVIASPFVSAPINQLSNNMSLVLNTAFNTAPEPATVSPFPTLFLYDESSAGTPTFYYDGFLVGFKVPTTTDFEVMRGYQANVSALTTLDLNGTLNNGNIGSINITNNGLGAPNGSFNLMGNPYPSPILWNELYNNSTGVANAIYIDIPTSRYGTNYASYVNDVGVNGGTNQIATMQGFWVEAEPAGGSLTYNNDIRVTSYTNPRFFGEEEEKGLKEGLIKMQIKKDNHIGDEMAIYFEKGATADFDYYYDARKLRLHNGNAPSLYSFYEGEEKSLFFAINGMPSFNVSMQIPIAVDIKQEGRHTVSLSELKYFHDLHKVYLYDSLTHMMHDLKENPEYAFNATPGLTQKRFVLLFELPEGSGVFEDDKLVLYPNPSTERISFSLKNNFEGEYSIKIYDVLGREITGFKQVKEGAFLQGKLDISNYANGVYILELSNNKESLQKRFLKE